MMPIMATCSISQSGATFSHPIIMHTLFAFSVFIKRAIHCKTYRMDWIRFPTECRWVCAQVLVRGLRRLSLSFHVLIIHHTLLLTPLTLCTAVDITSHRHTNTNKQSSIQLPRNDTALDVPACCSHRQYICTQTNREGTVGITPTGEVST